MVWRLNALRAYRLLLHAYPAEFRNEYGKEMEHLFESRFETECRLRLWSEVIADLVLTAPREHLHLLTSDLRYGFRALRKRPGLVSTALLTVVLGVSATTTVFSLINAVLIRSLPYDNPERLAYLWTPLRNTSGIEKEVSPLYEDMMAWRKMNRSFSEITAMQRYSALLNDRNAERTGAARVPGNFFRTLGARPQFGRVIEATDDRVGAPLVAVISDALWRSEFGSDSAVLGKILHLDRHAYRVVGVMPKEFSYPHGNDFPGQSQFAWMQRTDIWVPASVTPQERATPDFGFDAAVGRLQSGVSLRQAQAELSAIESHLTTTHTKDTPEVGMLVVPFIETILGPVRPLMRLLMGSVCLVLCMAAGNLASLLMARASERIHEMGVRIALGAERSRLVRLLMTESLMLSISGGILAIPISYAGLKVIVKLNPRDIPRFEETTLDLRVLLFCSLASVATGFVAGLVPALSASVVDINAQLRQGGRGIAGGSLRVRNILIVAEVALSVVLLAGAGLMIRSYLFVQNEDKGFAASTLTMSIQLDPQTKESDRIRRELMDRIRVLPGVEIAGSIDDLPLSTAQDKGFLEVEGRVSARNELVSARTTAGEYFGAMQIPLIAGRYLKDSDISKKPNEWMPENVVVSKSFAERYFPNANGIGHRLRINESSWARIAGVVGDVRHSGLESAPEPTVYLQDGKVDTLVVRTAEAPDAVIRSVRQIIRAFDPAGVVTDIRTMRQYVDQAAARRRFQTIVLTSFAGIAVFLVLAGLVGLLSFAVQQRMAEISIRMVVGASRGSIVRMVILHGLKLTSAGVLIGISAAMTLTRLMTTFIYGVYAIDPLTFLTVPALIIIAAVIACGVPARKAAGIDPLNAWRCQ
jgi:predicted permease